MAELARIRVWANALIALHLDPAVWTFDFDHARTRAGLCDFTRHRISMSRHLAAEMDDDEAHQVLLHEVAHALAGPNEGHGAAWKRIARELGYVGGRTHSRPPALELAKWVGVCPNGHEHVRFRRPARETSCAKCSRTFDARFRIRWRAQET